MLETLLRTKLFIPPLRPNLVPRPRLIERLNQGLHLGHKLTLISAPAGFGKTTLLSEWLAACQRPAAWLSLDEGDNDPTRFLTYLVAALQTLALSEVEGSPPVIGEEALAMLQSPGPAPSESILTSLLNEITAVADNFILVLDDYHLIDAQALDKALTFLLEHLPQQMHLVIATREDLNLPMARMRGRGQLSELRAADLRFTPAETAAFLNQAKGLDLSTKDIAALETRTEGWITGLQLAALSMQGSKDATGFIQSFTGSHRFVLDYLLEEVLHQQSEGVQTFLLHTSLLDRLSGPLCDAVLRDPSASGQKTLEYLEQANLFIVPLDNERRWYRYHHLFADLMRLRLRQIEPQQIPTLHSRASEWYEQNGFTDEAIEHSLRADDFERAAGLAELTWQAMDNSFQSAAWLGWVKKLPDELVRARPVLSTQYASALRMGGELEASEARLRDAERWLDPTADKNAWSEGSADEMVVVDEEQFRTLPAKIALARAYNVQSQGDVSGAAKYAELALKLTPEEDHLGRAQAIVTLGFNYWMSGDLQAANMALAGWIDSMQKVGNIIFAVASAFALADIMVAQGLLHEAVRTYKQSLQLASEQDKHVQRVIAHHYLGLAMLYHEMGDQEAAAEHLLKSRELGEQSTLIDWPYRWCLARAQLKESAGDMEAALDLLDEAKRLYVRVSVPDSRPIEALKARVYVRQGRLNEALDWARDQGLSVDDEISYLREFEHITLARVLIAEYQSSREERSVLRAIALLERLLLAAQESRRMGSVIEILILQTLAHHAQGNIPLALAPLERTLALAEPQGYVRVFVDEGVPMAQLLSAAAAQGIMPDYTGKLLAAFPSAEAQQTVSSETHSEIRNLKSKIVEPLSQRELEVLQLIAEGLTNREIAGRLYLSLNTVKVHTRNIYGKLDVHHRAQAVARARALGILPSV